LWCVGILEKKTIDGELESRKSSSNNEMRWGKTGPIP